MRLKIKMTENEKQIVESFKNIKNEVGSSNTVKSTMMKVFIEFPESTFKQLDFSLRLKKRTQHINHMLKELLEEKKIVRSGSRKQYYYQLSKK